MQNPKNKLSKAGDWVLKHEIQWQKEGLSAPASHPILIAEDSEADIYFLLRAFDSAKVCNAIFVVRDGVEALRYLKGEGRFGNRERYPVPRIVFLDLYMPGVDGFEILRWRQNQAELREVLFVALSNTNSIKDINHAYSLGANTFLSKPLEGAEVRNLIDAFHEHWLLKEPSQKREVPQRTSSR